MGDVTSHEDHDRRDGFSGGYNQQATELAYRLGGAIARQGCANSITGACPGLPHDAVRGAKAAGPVSPWECRPAHNFRRAHHQV